MIVYDDNLKIFYSTLVNDQSYFSGFGTRFLGNGRQAKEIFNFFTQRQTEFKKIVILGQIHSTNIVNFISKLNNNNIEIIEDSDGVITKEEGVILTVRTADCVPIIYVEKKIGLIGISHQGWRGSLKKMAQKMILKMIDQGAKEADTIGVIGPAIGSCCYDINQDRYYQFLEEFNDYSSEIFQFRGNKKYVNLSRLNFMLLKEIGLKERNIDFFPFCTACDRKRFYSFRRDKKEGHAEMFHFIMKSEKPKLFSEPY